MRRIPWLSVGAVAAVAVALSAIGVKNVEGDVNHQILNVSYDPTRELYARLDHQFVTDIDALRKRGLIADGWANRLPHHSQPYYSTIVFVVRHGNPKDIHDWPDLIKPGVEVITPDPRTSGNGKLSALAAWGATTTRGRTDAEALSYLRALYRHATRLDSGARGAATTFVVERLGDVQLTWENEAIRELADTPGELDIVYPPVSILAEPYVAWVDRNVARHHTERYARAYLDYLFTDSAQEIVAQAGYRPVNAAIASKYADRLRPIKLFSVTDIARDWDDANHRFFDENGIIDTVTSSTDPAAAKSTSPRGPA